MIDWTRIKVDFSNGEGCRHHYVYRANLVDEVELLAIDTAVEAMKKLYDRRPPQEPRTKDGEPTYRFYVFSGADEVIQLFYPLDKLPMVTYDLAAYIVTR